MGLCKNAEPLDDSLQNGSNHLGQNQVVRDKAYRIITLEAKSWRKGVVLLKKGGGGIPQDLQKKEEKTKNGALHRS